MKVNVNHPSFISFLEQVTNNILSNITVENYFTLSQDKKKNVQLIVYKLLKNAVRVRAKLSDTELRGFLIVLLKKCEENEKYEFTAILNDINNNFDKINEQTNQKKKTNKPIKIENSD